MRTFLKIILFPFKMIMRFIIWVFKKIVKIFWSIVKWFLKIPLRILNGLLVSLVIVVLLILFFVYPGWALAWI